MGALEMGNLIVFNYRLEWSATAMINLCITFVIAGNFDEIITRSGLILFTLQLKLKRTERNKTIRNE